MISKCANPSCSAAFHTLRDGRVFVREVEVDPHSGGARQRRVLRYVWLCNSCCQKLTVEVQDGKINLIARAPNGRNPQAEASSRTRAS